MTPLQHAVKEYALAMDEHDLMLSAAQENLTSHSPEFLEHHRRFREHMDNCNLWVSRTHLTYESFSFFDNECKEAQERCQNALDRDDLITAELEEKRSRDALGRMVAERRRMG